MKFELNQKNIIITGSNGLIGSKLVEDLQEAGANVIKVDLDDNKSDLFYNIDITSYDKVNEFVDKLYEKFERIDCVVHNAYPRTTEWSKKNFLEECQHDWNENLLKQLSSHINLTRCIMKKYDCFTKTSFIYMSSIYGIVGNIKSIYDNASFISPSAYSVIKGGINAFVRYMTGMYCDKGYRFNSIAPGGIYNGQDDNFVEAYEGFVPMKRMARAGDISGVVMFLCSDHSNYISGQTIAVDGGWTTV